MSKLNQILVIILAVQAAGLAVGRALTGGPPERRVVELFADLDVDKVTSIEILGPPKIEADDPPQNRVELAKVDGKWGIANADAYPVDKSKVDDLLQDLAAIRTRNVVLDSSTYHEKLEVAPDKYQRKVTVTEGDEQTVLYVGSSPRFKNVHVRLDGDDTVYLVNDFGTTQLGDRAWSWVDREYLKVPPEELWQVKLKNTKGEVQLDKDPVSKDWAVLGLTGELDESAINDFVRKAGTVNLESPVGKTVEPAYGLSDPTATITLTTGTSTVAGLPPPTTETVTWTIGKKIEDANQYYVKADDNPYVVKVAGWSLKPLVDKTTADFKKEEEEEEE